MFFDITTQLCRYNEIKRQLFIYQALCTQMHMHPPDMGVRWIIVGQTTCDLAADSLQAPVEERSLVILILESIACMWEMCLCDRTGLANHF